MEKKKYNKDNIATILEMKIDSLKEQQRTGKDQSSAFGFAVASKIKDGTFTEADLIATQEHGLSGKDIGDVSIHMIKGKTGMSYHEAIEMGHKIQFIYISYHQAQGRTDGMRLFGESMQPHEDGIEAIHNGTYDSTKLAVLESLPTIENWDHDLAIEAYPKIF